MKMIKKLSITALCLVSLNASASIIYDKYELVKNINQAIKEVQQLNDYEAPYNCKWHVKKTSSYVYMARKYIFGDYELSFKQQLIMADKSLKDLKYEGAECEQLKFKSKKISNLIHDALENSQNKKIK